MTSSPSDTITVSTGMLQGRRAGNLTVFQGVPYAAAPVGDRRFAEPAPVVPWDGVRQATAAGPNAPQRTRCVPRLDATPLIGHGWTEGDAYLTLDVWQPPASGDRSPVMVFIHGGGFVVGSKDAAVQDGGAFARDGIVYVAINYRMGVDGFLPIPGVPTNLGLRDMIAALRWVREEIAAFGGDPDNVTVFGESAGAMAIADLIASPRRWASRSSRWKLFERQPRCAGWTQAGQLCMKAKDASGRVIQWQKRFIDRTTGGSRFERFPVDSIKTAYEKTLIAAGITAHAIDEEGKAIWLPPRGHLEETSMRPKLVGSGSPNTLRHTATTQMHARGVPEAQIETAAGHAGETTNKKHYRHLRPEYLHAYIDGVESLWEDIGKLTTVHLRSQRDPKIVDLGARRFDR